MSKKKKKNLGKVNPQVKKKKKFTVDIDGDHYGNFESMKKNKRQAKESTEDVDNQLHMHTNIGINIIPLKTFRGNHLSFFFGGGGGGEREREREIG
jgi:hypothetical protein